MDGERRTARRWFIGAMVLAAACTGTGSTRPSAAPEVTAHATGATDVLIRVGRYQNDNVDHFTRGPTFTLYGDGTIIQGEWLTWRSNRIDEDQIQEVLRLATESGLFEPPFRHTSPVPGAPDDDDRGLIVYVNFGGSTAEQRIDGDPAFDAVKPIVEFADRLRTLGVDAPPSGWEPTDYYALLWDPSCRLVETDHPPADAFYYTWPILPDVVGVPVEQIFRC